MSDPQAPYYTILNPPPPPNPVLSDVRLNKKIDINHDEYLKRLKSYMELFRDRDSFWIEASILDRLHYKNINQQRPFHRFKRSMELRRLLKRLKLISLDKELERLYLCFWNAKSLENCKSKQNCIPSKESIQYTLHRMIGTALLLDKVKVCLLETYRANSTLLKLEHFVSLAIVYMGICSRMFKICHIWVNQIEECYHMLQTWSLCFPSGLKLKEQETFKKNNNLLCDEDTLKQTRSKYSNETLEHKSSIQCKTHLESYLVSQTIFDKVKAVQKEQRVNGDVSFIEEMDFEDLGEVIQR